MLDCIVFEYDKEPYVIRVSPKQISINFGKDGKGLPIDRRIGVSSITSPGQQKKYLYVSNYDNPPSRAELTAAISMLKPKSYEI